MTTEDIRKELFSLQDAGYRGFQIKLIPSVDPERVIGVRTPELRAFAARLMKDGSARDFLAELPHAYFDEDQLHAFMISGIRDYAACMEEVERFLPYIDNWATCDQLSPKVFKKHKAELLEKIRVWMGSGETYTVRFGMGMLMQHYLDEDFDPAYLEMAAGIRSDEYYVNMMTAWYFATALTKQYDSALPFIEGRRLDRWTHNKAVQKALESYRIPQERKDHLRSLKIK